VIPRQIHLLLENGSAGSRSESLANYSALSRPFDIKQQLKRRNIYDVGMADGAVDGIPPYNYPPRHLCCLYKDPVLYSL